MINLINMTKILLIIITSILPISAIAQEIPENNVAKEKQEYLRILPEVPLMYGLYEVTNSMFVFDKPDGRISEIMYFSDSVSLEDVENYYIDVLPQLGWIKSETGLVFIREQEILAILMSKSEGELILKFSISPYKDPINK